MYVYTVEHDVLLRRPNSLQCNFFFFFELEKKLQLLKLNLEVKNVPKMGIWT